MEISIFKKIPWPVYLRIISGIGGLGGGLHVLITPVEFIEKIKMFAETTPFIWYAGILETIFLANPTFAIYLMSLVPILAGIFLISGFCINLGCVLGILISLHYIACQPVQAIFNLPLIILILIVLFSKRSRRYSLDERIFKKFQKS